MASDRNTLVGLSKKEVFIIQIGYPKSQGQNTVGWMKTGTGRANVFKTGRPHSLELSCLDHMVKKGHLQSHRAVLQPPIPRYRIQLTQSGQGSTHGPSNHKQTGQQPGTARAAMDPLREGRVGGEKKTYSFQCMLCMHVHV